MIMHPVRINPHWFFAMSMRTPVGMVAEPLETCRMVCREANWKSLRPRDFWMTGSINSMLAMYQWVMPWPMDRLVRMKAPLRGRRTFSSAGDAVPPQNRNPHFMAVHRYSQHATRFSLPRSTGRGISSTRRLATMRHGENLCCNCRRVRDDEGG